MNNKQKGNEGEKFVADYLSGLGFVVEIHPRTFRRIFVKGKELYISQDNDYHNCFDIKAEGVEQMIYAQVKWFPKHAIDSGNVSKGRIKIDKAYPYTFPYIRVQVWMVWKEWVSHPRRHKEFRKRISHMCLPSGLIPLCEGALPALYTFLRRRSRAVVV